MSDRSLPDPPTRASATLEGPLIRTSICLAGGTHELGVAAPTGPASPRSSTASRMVRHRYRRGWPGGERCGSPTSVSIRVGGRVSPVHIPNGHQTPPDGSLHPLGRRPAISPPLTSLETPGPAIGQAHRVRDMAALAVEDSTNVWISGYGASMLGGRRHSMGLPVRPKVVTPQGVDNLRVGGPREVASSGSALEDRVPCPKVIMPKIRFDALWPD